MTAASAIVAPWRPRVLTPGMPALDSGVERYVVRGGGILGVELAPGDRIELADSDGGQPAELVLFARDGRDLSAAGGLETRPPCAPCLLPT
jgi:hypothetical protein